MKLTRFHQNDRHVSVFSEIDVALPQTRTDAGASCRLSEAIGAVNALLVELPAGLDQDWHPAPTRQLVVVLSGRLQVEVASGEQREWGPGGIFFADDTGGQGHLTRVPDGPARLFVCLPENFDLATLTG